MPSRAKTAAKAARARRPKAPKRRSAATTVKSPALARVARERDEALEQQAATAEILKVISQSAFDLSAVLQALVSSAVRLCEADTGIVRRREGDNYPVAATFGFSDIEHDHFARYSAKPDRGSVFGRAILESRSIHVPDLLADRHLNRDRRKDYSKVITIRTGLGVPLLREGRTIGVFTLQRRKRRPFTKKQIALAETFANQAVIAIENTRLFDEVQARTRDLSEALDQQTATSEVLEVISASPGELAPVFSKMLENATRVCEATFGIMNLWDGAQFRTAAGHNVPPAFAAVRRDKPIEPHPQSLLFKVLETHRLVHVHDARIGAGYLAGAPNAVEMVEVAGARTVLIVPMLKEDELIGTFTIFRQEVRPFTDRQIALLENFTRQAVIAIENTRLINETKEALERQKASSDILRVISSSMADAQPVFDKILDSCKHLFGSDETAVLLLDGENTVTLGAYVGKQYDAVAASFPAPLEKSPAGRAIRERRVVHYTDVANDPRLTRTVRRVAQLAGYESMAYAPMMSNGRGIGAIGASRNKAAFSDKELTLLQTFADQAVIAIENARLFNETQEALEQQRAIAALLSVINRSGGDLSPVFNCILENAHHLCGAPCGSLQLYEEGRVRPVAIRGMTPAFAAFLRAGYPITDSIRGGLMADHPVQTLDMAEVFRSRPDEPSLRAAVELGGIRSTTTVPLAKDGVTFGRIVAARQEVRPFEQKQIALLQSFAGQAVIAIENARLFNETKEGLERQTATADILKVIASSPDNIQPVFEAIASSANRLIGGFSTSVYRFIDGIAHLAAFTPTSPGADQVLRSMYPRPTSDFPQFELARTSGNTWQIPDAEETPEPAIRTIARTRGWRSSLGAPLISNGATIGLITVTRTHVGSFSDHHVQLLQTFADQAVIAVENVRLFDEVQAKTRELSESLTYQTGSANILRVIASTPTDAGPALKAIVESACDLCEAYDCVMVLKDGNDLRFSAHHGPIPISIEKWPINRRWTAGRAFVDQQPVHVHDLLAEGDEFPDGRELSQRMGHRTILSVPLLREGESIGAMVLRRTEVMPFSDKQISLLKTFADQAVIAIGNVRLFEEVQERTRDLQESLQQQTATADVLKVISRSAFDLDSVLSTLVASAAQLCEAERGLIFLRDGDFFHTSANFGFSPELEAFARANPLPADGKSTTARAGASGLPVQAVDLLADETQGHLAREYQRLGGHRTNLGVPLRRDGKTVGVFTLTRQVVRAFTPRQIELVQTFADQAVIAIENVRLFEEVQARTRDLQESLQQQTATADVLGVISASPGDLVPIFDKMLENAIRVCGAEFGSMNLAADGGMRPAAQYNVPAEYAAARGDRIFTPHPTSPLATAMRTRQVVQWADLRTTESYLERYPSAVELVELGGARTVAIVPMLRDEEAIGAITIYRKEEQLFSDKQIELLSNFAKQAVIAIENARLLRELRQRTDDLTKSLDNLRAAQDRLVQTEKLASLGQLTAGIAHEIKNPLNFVNNFSALSAELTEELNDVLKPVALDDRVRGEVDELTDLLKDNLEKVVQHGRRADSIVKNMLLHSREGSGELRSVDINALVDEGLNLAYHGARAEKSGFNITLQRDFDADAGSLQLFPQEITRALLNLISNGFYAAIKRQRENGGQNFEPMLRAATKNLGSAVEIRIRDNGTGIPSEVKEKMFNPFFTTKPAGEGTGLGLSMTHDIIVKQHGGRIDVLTEPGHFAEFVIVLPRSGPRQ